MKRYKFTIWVNSNGQSFDVIIEADSAYHAQMQAKAQYPTAYQVCFVATYN